MSLFTSKVDYALRALLDLADQPANRAAQSREIAARQSIPEAYLNQLLVVLRRAGLVRSIRGAAGGYVLARPARQITVCEVVRAFQGDEYLGAPGEEPCAPDASAAWVVRGLRERLEEAVREVLQGTTVADLDEERRRLDESKSMMAGI